MFNHHDRVVTPVGTGFVIKESDVKSFYIVQLDNNDSTDVHVDEIVKVDSAENY